jgi:hypothetical protein
MIDTTVYTPLLDASVAACNIEKLTEPIDPQLAPEQLWIMVAPSEAEYADFDAYWAKLLVCMKNDLEESLLVRYYRADVFYLSNGKLVLNIQAAEAPSVEEFKQELEGMLS